MNETNKKLTLHAETVRNLTEADLKTIDGGGAAMPESGWPWCGCPTVDGSIPTGY